MIYAPAASRAGAGLDRALAVAVVLRRVGERDFAAAKPLLDRLLAGSHRWEREAPAAARF